MDFKILLLFFLAAVSRIVVSQETPASLYPYGPNPPRVNPEYCVGFNITYPTEYGKVYKHGEMAHLTWKVDPNLAVPADIITRIRVMNDQQRNIYTVGGNITLHTYKNKGSVVFPMYFRDVAGPSHFRIMVNYPGTALHCVFESVSFTVAPPPFQRYQANDTPPPKWAVPNAISIKERFERKDRFSH